MHCRYLGLPLLIYLWLALGCAGGQHNSSGQIPDLAPPVALSQPANLIWVSDGAEELTTTSPQAWYHDSERVLTETGKLPSMHGASGRAFEPTATAVQARVWGHFAEVQVCQTFTHAEQEPLEAVYTFPLPENSAVFAMDMHIGERHISAEIQDRAEARANYEAARALGMKAALLDQVRSNIFHQSVANVPPKEPVEVCLHYQQELTVDSGIAEFVFPMVVGERYFPTGSDPGDIALVNTSAVGQAKRSGLRFSLSVDVGRPLKHGQWWAPTQAVDVDLSAGLVQLRPREELPNRDFVLRFPINEGGAEAALHMGEDGYFSVYLSPPRVDADAHVGRRELIFVVDNSGSMSGEPLSTAKRAMEIALTHLRPVDTFNVITFAGHSERLWTTPRPVNNSTIARARAFVDGMGSSGGTEIRSAIELAMEAPPTPGRHRYVLFITDGQVGNEAELVAAAARLIRKSKDPKSQSRVFAFGVGPHPNRALLRDLASAGKGFADFGVSERAPEDIVRRMLRVIDKPVWLNPRIDWQGAEVELLEPAVIPDLFVTRPIALHGRLVGNWRGHPRLWFGTAEGTVTKELVPQMGSTLPKLHARLWARARIQHLIAQLWSDSSGKIAEQIRRLGVEHQLLTTFTSFIAIDDTPLTEARQLEFSNVIDVQGHSASHKPGYKLAGQGSAPESYYTIGGGGAPIKSEFVAEYSVISPELLDEVSSTLSGAPNPLIPRVGQETHSPAEAVARLRIRRPKQAQHRPLRQAILKRRAELRGCVEDHGWPHPYDERRFKLIVDVGAGGRVWSVIIEDGLHNHAARTCIEQVLLQVRAIDSANSRVTLRARF